MRTPAKASVQPSLKAATPPCACGRLRRAARALTQLYDDVMAPSGLRVTQFSLLRALARDDTMRISDLAERQLLDRTALSRNLDPLVSRGLVTIDPGHDARTREVRLSAKGRAALRAAEGLWRRAQAEVAARIGEKRLAVLIETLGELEALHPSAGVAAQSRPSRSRAARASASS